MKCILVFCVLVSIVYTLPADIYKTEWKKFKVTYNKLYESEHEENSRFEIFCRTLDKINEHNQLYEHGQTSYMMRVNEFSDLTDEEYQKMLGILHNENVLMNRVSGDDLYREEWENYKVKFGKSYDSNEDAVRYEIFYKNLEIIQKHNEDYKNGLTSFEMGLNDFTDMTPEEIKKFMGLHRPESFIVTNGNDHCETEWEKFKESFNRVYSSSEDEMRSEIFCKSLRMIEHHNSEYEKGLTTYKMTINQFSDMTDEEMSRHMGLLPQHSSRSVRSTENSCQEQYEKFKESFNKFYESQDEDKIHFDIFCKNIEIIEKHNEDFMKGITTFEMGVNRFTDMTEEELQNYLGFKPNDMPTVLIRIPTSENSCDEEYEKYKESFDKLYETEEEENIHLDIFCRNLKMIKKHNEDFAKGITSYEMSVNKFTDMTNEELQRYLGFIPNGTTAVMTRLLSSENSCEEDYEKYKESFDKLYETEEEEKIHLDVFCENLKMIKKHNEDFVKGTTSYKMGVNRFTDMTDEELQKYLGFKPNGPTAVMTKLFSSENTCEEDYEKYKESFDKLYETEEEEKIHLDIFCRNLKMIEKHNENYVKGITSYKMAVNRFTDMTHEELQRYLGFKPNGATALLTEMPSNKKSCEEEYVKYKKNFGKVYESENAEQIHLNIFCKNLQSIYEHNQLYEQGQSSFKMGINIFTDMTSEEKQRYLGLISPDHDIDYSSVQSEQHLHEEEWQAFKDTYKKKYLSDDEEDYRHQVFSQNFDEILEHNKKYQKGETTFQMGVNQFSDMTEKEYQNYVNNGLLH